MSIYTINVSLHVILLLSFVIDSENDLEKDQTSRKGLVKNGELVSKHFHLDPL